jgi:hypothetical protein
MAAYIAEIRIIDVRPFLDVVELLGKHRDLLPSDLVLALDALVDKETSGEIIVKCSAADPKKITAEVQKQINEQLGENNGR